MRVACIDIGTNTTRLLVAESHGAGLREVLSLRSFNGLGHVWTQGRIAPQSMQAVVAAVVEQVACARRAGTLLLSVVATAGVREAANAQDLLDAVAAATGVLPRLLSGEEEARLAFAGATHGGELRPDEALLVVDIGGGSTELVVGTPARGACWSVSLPVGSAVLVHEGGLADPPTAAQLTRAADAVRGLLGSVDVPPCPRGLAVGGSATSLGRLLGETLDGEALTAALARLTAAPAADLAERLDLDPRRVRLLPAGIVILQAVSEKVGVPLRIGRGGLREGVILAQLRAARGGARGCG